jgi:DNA invertase Pin-like site-specific DNA recombinase
MISPPPPGAVIGYARTSTAEQRAGLEAQIEELKAAGCRKVFSEQVSSVDAARPQLRAALDYLREGDTFVVTRPDRLARSTIDLLNIVDGLTKRGVSVRIESMSLDTSKATGRLILTVMGGIAEFERSLMLERQRAGIARAKAEGKYRGRAPTARAKSAEILALKAEGHGVAEIVRRTGVSRASAYRVLNGPLADATSFPAPAG